MAKNKPIGVGIIGLGRAGREMHVMELKENPRFRIAAGCDAIEERPRKLAAEFGATPYTDHRKMLLDPSVELVVVATRQDTHADIAVEALRAGKHVIVEKPIGTSLGEADRIFAVAKEMERLVFPRHNRRWDPDFQHVCEVVKSGILGRLFYARLCRHSYSRRNDWQTLKRFGGGQLNNWGPHIIDHALQFVGSDARVVFSDLQRVVAAGDAEDHVEIVLRGRSGTVVDIVISGGIAIPDPHFRLMGTLGTLVCDGKESRVKYLDPRDLPPLEADPGTPPEGAGFGRDQPLPWHEETRPAVPANPMPPFYECVYRSVREGVPFPVSPDDARNVMRVIEEARAGTAF
jgi:scyllo-inositol 2-dehydrogenase (NADP+)